MSRFEKMSAKSHGEKLAVCYQIAMNLLTADKSFKWG